jgi:hypothetical protein
VATAAPSIMAGENSTGSSKHGAVKQPLRCIAHGHAGQDAAQAVAQAQVRHVGKEGMPVGFEGLHGQFGIAVPAHKAATVVAVAVALDVAQPQVKVV